jgi:hypothetical protein
MAQTIGTESIWLFGEMEIDPTLTHKEMYEKAKDIAEHCGYLATAGRIGNTKLITVYDNDAVRHFRLQYNPPEPPLEVGQKWAYFLTKIEEWRRGKVWITPR